MSGYAADAAPAAAAAPAAEGKKEKAGKKDAKAAAPAVPAGPPPAEKSAEELAKMSKEERTAYHQARRAAGPAGGNAANAKAQPKAQLTKAQRRAIQDNQRKAKEDLANVGKEDDDVFEELKLQGLSDIQARAVLEEMKSGAIEVEDDEDDDDEPDDLLGSVRKWMGEQPDQLPSDAVRDFNMKVRFQGHVNTTPPDHLGCILNVLVNQALGACDLEAPKINPGAVAKALTPLLERWSVMLIGLYEKVPDVLEAVGVVVATITESVAATGAQAQGQDCAVVGCIMAIRELDDLVEDEDLLVGCKGVEPRSRVLEKYIDFLEDALEEDEEDDEESDK